MNPIEKIYLNMTDTETSKIKKRIINLLSAIGISL